MTPEKMPVGALLAAALMAAHIPCDSGEDVDRLITELEKRGVRLATNDDDDELLRAVSDAAADRDAALREQFAWTQVDGHTLWRLRGSTVDEHDPVRCAKCQSVDVPQGREAALREENGYLKVQLQHCEEGPWG